MDFLPLEVVRSIFELVPKADVHGLAQVSRHLRRVAVSTDRFFIYCHVVLRHGIPLSCDALNYALQYDIRLALVLDSHIPQDERIPAEIVDLVALALPILVKFKFSASVYQCQNFFTAMCRPAPMLRHLSLYAKKPIEEPLKLMFELPPGLFSGCAPRLSCVLLYRVSFPETPLKAFAGVKTLALQYQIGMPTVSVSKHFPSVRVLSLSCIMSRLKINCHGARHLTRLDLRSCDIFPWFKGRLRKHLPISIVPLVTCSNFLFFRSIKPLLEGRGGLLALQAGCAEFIAVRTLKDSKQTLIWHPVRNDLFDVLVKNTYDRLVDVQLDCAYFEIFVLVVGSSSESSISVLSTLRINGLSGTVLSQKLSEIVVHCASLVRIVLIDAAITVEDARLLARILGQDIRPVHQRARLELVERPLFDDISNALDGVFGSVLLSPVSAFQGPIVPVCKNIDDTDVAL